MSNREAIIVDAVRTPIGRIKGYYSGIEAYKLGSIVIDGLLDKSGIDSALVEDVFLGNLLAVPGNVARVAVLESKLHETSGAVTMDRQCASGLDAINIAAALIGSGQIDVGIAGGIENMTRAPYWLAKPEKPFDLSHPVFLQAMLSPPSVGDPSMIQTAVNVEKEYGITREEQDLFALRSQELTKAAVDKGYFNDQIIPVAIEKKKGAAEIVSVDESPRPDTTIGKLSSLSSLLGEGSGVTAGNSCPMNDGSAAVLIMEKNKARELGYKFGLKIRETAVAGLSPSLMGMGPVFAIEKLCSRFCYSLNDFDLIELNEAFAAQSIACLKTLKLSMDVVNPNGGAIALGHPLGATGAILTVKLFHEMKRRDLKTGLVTMCIGGGQGIATVLEQADL